MIRLTLVAMLLATAPAWAQVTYTATPGSGYLPLEGATVRGAINVRLASCPAGPWAFAVDGVAKNIEGSCPFDLMGDDFLYDTTGLSDGAHTITATSPATTPPLSARFTVANATPAPPPAPTWTGSSTLTWQAPTLNTDGTALTNLSGFKIKYGASAATLNQVITITNPALTRYVLDGLAAGTWFIGMTAFTPTTESDLSGIVSVTLTAPVCGSAPPLETRQQLCTPPLIGNWTQTNAWTPAPASSQPATCWLPDWLPTSAPAGICAQLPPPPPTCPPKPADVTRLASCPAGTTGTFAQTKGWTCLSGVWVAASSWAPLTPPAGSCPTTTTTWKVAPSLALPVYEAVLPSSGTTLVRGAQVGTIALAKPCGAQVFTDGGRSFRTVMASDVQLASPSYAGRVLVAACVLQ